MTSTSRPNIGPLTTTFTAPSSCSVALFAYGTGFQAQTCGSSTSAKDNIACWPSPSPDGPTPRPPFNGYGFYSPGLNCPAGYTSACSATAGGYTGWNVQFALTPGETAKGCCPRSVKLAGIHMLSWKLTIETSHFSCAQFLWAQTCLSVASSGATFLFASCESGSTANFTYFTLPYTTALQDTSSTTAAVTSTMSIYAPMIELRYMASDLSPTSTDANTAATSNSATRITLAPSSSTSAGNSGNQTSHLPAGAEAAIGVCVPVFVPALTAGLLLFWCKKSRRSRTPVPLSVDPLPSGAKEGGFSLFERRELGGNAIHEMDEPSWVHEMDGPSPAHELHGDNAHTNNK